MSPLQGFDIVNHNVFYNNVTPLGFWEKGEKRGRYLFSYILMSPLQGFVIVNHNVFYNNFTPSGFWDFFVIISLFIITTIISSLRDFLFSPFHLFYRSHAGAWERDKLHFAPCRMTQCFFQRWMRLVQNDGCFFSGGCASLIHPTRLASFAIDL